MLSGSWEMQIQVSQTQLVCWELTGDQGGRVETRWGERGKGAANCPPPLCETGAEECALPSALWLLDLSMLQEASLYCSLYTQKMASLSYPPRVVKWHYEYK